MLTQLVMTMIKAGWNTIVIYPATLEMEDF